MAPCKDPRLTYLNNHGYNVVRLPRQGLVPLGIIGRDGQSRAWLGTLDQIWHSREPVPQPGPPRAVASLQGQATNDIKIDAGLDILGNVLNGMFGSSAPRLDAAYKNAKMVQFAFREVRTVSIEPFVIGNFLAQGDLRSSPFVSRFFGGHDGVEALVVSEVLEARSIGVIAKRDASTEVEVDVPQIKAVLGAKVGVATSSARSSEVVYEGLEYLAFGYKAFFITRTGTQWAVEGLGPSGDHAFAAGDDPVATDVQRNELVELDFTLARP